jgi:hypothetical protein
VFSRCAAAPANHSTARPTRGGLRFPDRRGKRSRLLWRGWRDGFRPGTVHCFVVFSGGVPIRGHWCANASKQCAFFQGVAKAGFEGSQSPTLNSPSKSCLSLMLVNLGENLLPFFVSFASGPIETEKQRELSTVHR